MHDLDALWGTVFKKEKKATLRPYYLSVTMSRACLEISSAKLQRGSFPGAKDVMRHLSRASASCVPLLTRPPRLHPFFFLLSLPVSSLSRPSRYSDALSSNPRRRRPAGCLLEHELPSNELSSPFACGSGGRRRSALQPMRAPFRQHRGYCQNKRRRETHAAAQIIHNWHQRARRLSLGRYGTCSFCFSGKGLKPARSSCGFCLLWGTSVNHPR